MRRRCLDPLDKDWPNYGARGVTVCESWRRSFSAFWADMGPSYQDNLTLGRVDNDGPYSPDNCRWETVHQQANNRRTNTLVATSKGSMTLSQAARAFGLKPVTLLARIRRYGWTLERALNTPPSTTSSTVAHEIGSSSGA